jgi:1-hydroxycarotenoid 3,4-desaturase
VFFSADYETEFRELFERGSIPSAPTVYVCAQDRARAEAPAGDERLFMLVNAPALGDDDSFDPRSSTCVTAILRQLHACGLQVELEERASEVTTPREFEARYPTTGGALYGLATHGFRAPFQRPRARTRLRGLYLAGGGAHPGAGVPMVAMSGRIAARAVAADLGSTSTLGPVDTRGGTSTRSPATADTP